MSFIQKVLKHGAIKCTDYDSVFNICMHKQLITITYRHIAKMLVFKF